MIIIIGLVLAAAVIWFIHEYRKRDHSPSPPPAKPKNITFGSADLASWDQISGAGLLDIGRAESPNFLKGVVLGFINDPRTNFTTAEPLGYSGPGHILTVAPTRSGKFRDVLATALALYLGSCVVIDPKAQAAMVLARARRTRGNRVIVLNPFEEYAEKLGRTAGYNPVDIINPNSRGFGSDCDNLTDALITRGDEAGNSKHFNDRAANLVCGVLRHLVKYGPAATRNLPALRSIICNDEVLKAFCKEACATGDQITADKLSGFKEFGADNREVQDVLATARAQTDFIGNEAITACLKSWSFRFRDLKRERVTVFVTLPTRYIASCGKYFRLIVASMLNELLEGSPGIPVLAILDEFPQFGRLAALETAMKIAAGYGLQLWPFATDLSSMRLVYGETFSSFIGNSAVRQFFAPQEIFTAEYISKLCGTSTVMTANTTLGSSTSYGGSGNGPSSSTSSSTSVSPAQRPLATPDEVMRMAKDKQLLFIDNLPPIHAWRWPYYATDSQNMARLFDADPENPGSPQRAA